MNRLASGQPGARRFCIVRLLEIGSVQPCSGWPDCLLCNPLVQSDSHHRTARCGLPARLWAACFSSVRRCITSFAAAC